MINSWKYRLGRHMLFGLALLLPALAAQAKENDVVQKLTWQMDEPASEQQLEADDTHARVIIFRLTHKNDRYQAMPVNIFVNKQYHASLLPEHQAIGLSLCPGKQALLVVPGNLKDEASRTRQESQNSTPELVAGKTYYYQIAINNEGETQHRWVDAADADGVVKSIKIQTHTLSRVKNTPVCPFLNAKTDI